MDNINIIEHLINKIDLRNINYKLIKNNIDHLYKIFVKIKSHYNYKHYDYIHEKNRDIINILYTYTSQYTLLNKYINNINIIKLVDKNISFYYVGNNINSDSDKLQSLFNITISLAKYANFYNKNKEIVIIWLPVDIKRDFKYDKIDDKTLKYTQDMYKAFTASGCTFDKNGKRYTIISRYEEIEKLLLHELIHNFYLDYSNINHSCMKEYHDIKSGMDCYDYDYSMYESYTELLSTYYSIIFRNIHLVKKEDVINRLETEILCELLYSYNTIANLIRINGYKNYNDFMDKKSFIGNICVYEYYYLKGLLYNNFLLTDNVKDIYNNIVKIIDYNDSLLQDVYNNMIIQYNYRYNFYS